MRAVIVDDDSSIRTILTLMLENEGIHVFVADRMEQVLAAEPDIIFIDRIHALFTLDDLHTMHHAVTSPSTIIALDAMHGFMPETDAYVDQWLSKPFTVQQVKQIVSATAN